MTATSEQLVIDPAVAAADTADGVVVLNLDQADRQQQPLALDGTAHYLWQRLTASAPMTIEALVEQTAADYPDADPVALATDVRRFVELLRDRGILIE